MSRSRSSTEDSKTASDSVQEDIGGHHAKVPVHEDYLFDVDIGRRELAPAYWLGPIYEVRRGRCVHPDLSLATSLHYIQGSSQCELFEVSENAVSNYDIAGSIKKEQLCELVKKTSLLNLRRATLRSSHFVMQRSLANQLLDLP